MAHDSRLVVKLFMDQLKKDWSPLLNLQLKKILDSHCQLHTPIKLVSMFFLLVKISQCPSRKSHDIRQSRWGYYGSKCRQKAGNSGDDEGDQPNGMLSDTAWSEYSNLNTCSLSNGYRFNHTRHTCTFSRARDHTVKLLNSVAAELPWFSGFHRDTYSSIEQWL
jgi:hypothetical protein